LDVFDEVGLLLRAEPVERIEPGWGKVTGEGVKGIPLPYHPGLIGFMRDLPTTEYRIYRAIREYEAIQCRLPCHIGSLVVRTLQKGRPYGMELVGDPYMALSPDAYQHPLQKILRKLWRYNLQQEVKNAAVAGYVTEKTLQRDYPTDGFSTHFSSVELSEDLFISTPRNFDKLHRIISVGNMQNEVKGMDLLIDAVAHLPDTRLDLVGDGEIRPKLEAQVRSLSMQDRVYFHGYTKSRTELFAMLDQADLFALLSRSEGLPRVMIEAMARGLPAIGTRVGGIPELLPEQCIVEPSDRKSIIQLLQNLAQAPAELNTMSAQNLTKAREYSQDKLRVRRQQLYTELKKQTEQWLKKHQHF
jgi:glycosyltransferase involved in cell wall biosynthesis